MEYTLGLDIGIGSIGWAVLRNDINEEPCKIQDIGVRIFEKAEHPRTGASLAEPRRQARSMRRCIRRRRHRKERIKNLIESTGLMTKADMDLLFQNSGFPKDVYELRCDALERKLSRDEWVRVLLHLSQRRGYRSNSKAEEAKDKENGVLKTAISSNQKLMQEKGYRTVGEMFCKDPKFQAVAADGTVWRTTRNTSGDYKFTVTRDMIEKEAELLFSMQRAFGNEFADEDFQRTYSAILFSQRNFDEGPGGNSPYRQMDLRGYCIFEQNERRAFKACYTFEYFKLLQDINHIRILTPESSRTLTPDEREKICALAMKSDALTYARLRKELALQDGVTFNMVRYEKETAEEAEKASKFPQMQSYHKIRKALNHLSSGYISLLSHDTLDEIGTILSLYKADNKRVEALKKIGLEDKVINELLPLSFSKVGNLSLTAMKKLLPFLEKGVNYNEACSTVYGDFRGHQAGTRCKTLSLNPDFLEETQLQEKIKNPVVFRAISQTCKVVSAIIRKYGSPQVIRIELAREMSKNFEERIKTDKKILDNQKKNENAMEHIREMKGDHATGQDLVKWKLYQEQDGICLYSGKSIDAEKLFEPGYVEVDHVIPYSISFDDSYRNKVLVMSEENRQKGNRIPLEYMANDPAKAGEFTTRVETQIRDFRKRQKLLKKQLTDDDFSGFKDRNLTDTQYIARVVYHLFNDYLEFAPSEKYAKKPVRAVNGAITDYMRKRFGLKKNRNNGDLHHAMDAAVIAVTTDSMIQRISNYSKSREWGQKYQGKYTDPETGELLSQADYDEKYGPHFPEPWLHYRKELEARLGPTPEEDIMRLHLPTYESDEVVPPIFVSHMPRRSVTGAAHQQTIWSGRDRGMYIQKIPLTSLKLKNGEIEDYYNPGSDRLLYEALLSRLQAFGGNAKAAFAEPFYKPKKDGSAGPLVKKIKLRKSVTKYVDTAGGIAGNGNMVRCDVFHVKDKGYYFVPIYTADTVKRELPCRAPVAGKGVHEWTVMKDEDFLFSLYPGDAIRIESKKGFKLKKKSPDADGEPELFRKEALMYFTGADISTGSWNIVTHDRKYFVHGIGIKRLQKLEKYEVDILGNCHKVSLPEKRQPFSGSETR